MSVPEMTWDISCNFSLSLAALSRWSLQPLTAWVLQVASNGKWGLALLHRRRVSEPRAGQRWQQPVYLLLAGPKEPAEPELHQGVPLPSHTDTNRVGGCEQNIWAERNNNSPNHPMGINQDVFLSVIPAVLKEGSAFTVWPCRMSNSFALSFRKKNFSWVILIYLSHSDNLFQMVKCLFDFTN